MGVQDQINSLSVQWKSACEKYYEALYARKKNPLLPESDVKEALLKVKSLEDEMKALSRERDEIAAEVKELIKQPQLKQPAERFDDQDNPLIVEGDGNDSDEYELVDE
ncbi:MAG: hypothetical protein FDZ69_13735 [Deltaproteobacteria bacterium]|nr:MAG: hypothetical protein FDZ69_13735 [Deltaproteobacteria bacterium]